MTPTVRCLLAAATAAALLALPACGGAAGTGGQGQNYPAKPVTFTAPSEPGSGWDTTARALAEAIKKEDVIDVALPVQNRPGATGCVWINQMVNDYRGEPYQIAVTSLPSMSTKLRGECDYGYQDVTMIARLITEYFLVVAPADSPHGDIEELLAAIKNDPEGVPIAAAGDDRLPFALLVQAAGGDPEKINFIQYEGGGQQTQAMLAGDVDAAIAGVSEFRGQVEAGALRGLVVLRDEALGAPFNDIPTTVELGYDVTLSNWRGIYGPPDMPEYAVTFWEKALKEAVGTETWRQLAERNQWDTTYMKDQEMRRYLDKTYGEIRTALEQTGAVS